MRDLFLKILLSLYLTITVTPVHAWLYKEILVDAKMIADKPKVIKLAVVWQMHLDTYTELYELDKHSKSYSELISILGDEKIELGKSLNIADKESLSRFLKTLTGQLTSSSLRLGRPKWIAKKNEDGSIDIALRKYEPEIWRKVYFRFKKEDSIYKTIDEAVGTISLNKTKSIEPFLTPQQVEQFFTEDKIIYVTEKNSKTKIRQTTIDSGKQ